MQRDRRRSWNLCLRKKLVLTNLVLDLRRGRLGWCRGRWARNCRRRRGRSRRRSRLRRRGLHRHDGTLRRECRTSVGNRQVHRLRLDHRLVRHGRLLHRRRRRPTGKNRSKRLKRTTLGCGAAAEGVRGLRVMYKLCLSCTRLLRKSLCWLRLPRRNWRRRGPCRRSGDRRRCRRGHRHRRALASGTGLGVLLDNRERHVHHVRLEVAFVTVHEPAAGVIRRPIVIPVPEQD
jgi:hypothetical protein